MRSSALLRSALLLLCTLLRASTAEVQGQKVLVLFESVAYSSSYSEYLDGIRRQGYEIEQRSALDPNLHLREWDHWKYDKLIILASGVKGKDRQIGPAKLSFVERITLLAMLDSPLHC